jgi:hypothetical protein
MVVIEMLQYEGIDSQIVNGILVAAFGESVSVAGQLGHDHVERGIAGEVCLGA